MSAEFKSRDAQSCHRKRSIASRGEQFRSRRSAKRVQPCLRSANVCRIQPSAVVRARARHGDSWWIFRSPNQKVRNRRHSRESQREWSLCDRRAVKSHVTSFDAGRRLSTESTREAERSPRWPRSGARFDAARCCRRSTRSPALECLPNSSGFWSALLHRRARAARRQLALSCELGLSSRTVSARSSERFPLRS